MRISLPALRMRTLLLIPLLLIPVGLSTASLLVVRWNMQRELRHEIAQDLLHSTSAFRNLERSRREMLARDAILVADQPSLKALMTTRDPSTIQNAGVEYARLSGSDLFALTSQSGRLIALYQDGHDSLVDLEPAISHALQNPGSSPYVIVYGKLYEIAAQPIYFGSSDNGSVLGYLILGTSIDQSLAHQVAQSLSGEVAFYTNRRIVGSSLPSGQESSLASLLQSSASTPSTFQLGDDRYQLDRITLSGESSIPIEMIVLKSLKTFQDEEARLNRMTISLGIVAFVIGGLLALGVARFLTAPLESLAIGVRAFGAAQYESQLPDFGAVEVRGLSHDVDAMRKQIRKAQSDLVESERLAIIGKMASSVSHDFRHYLASVYANAEFLASPDLTSEDRIELLQDIRLSVRGTTDLIDSLLLFSRTGKSLNKSYESVAYLAERAIALLHNHPDTNGVEVSFKAAGNCETLLDVKKIERVIYNLTLNACQSAQKGEPPKLVQVSTAESEESVMVRVIDSGAGVPPEIRESLFEPFISANKENGVGIGLTLASTIAVEHGGSVRLEATAPGRTVFCLLLPRIFATQPQLNAKMP